MRNNLWQVTSAHWADGAQVKCLTGSKEMMEATFFFFLHKMYGVVGCVLSPSSTVANYDFVGGGGASVLVTDRTKSFVLSGLHLSHRSSNSSPTHFVHCVSLISGPPHGHPMIVSMNLSCCSTSGLHCSCINRMLPHHSLFLLPNIMQATNFCARLPFCTNLPVCGILLDILFASYFLVEYLLIKWSYMSFYQCYYWALPRMVSICLST